MTSYKLARVNRRRVSVSRRARRRSMASMLLNKTYGACGVQGCQDCRPLFDADNQVIVGTEVTS